MDLFSSSAAALSTSPLSEILRPKNLDEIIGQEKTIGSQSKLGQMLRKGYLPSLIIWGPPGTGKTTFALALSQHFKAHFENINATEAGTKVLREIGEAGHDRRLQYQQKTILFVDEIHRFNKGQQDVLLPFVEKGDIVLVGATTENPSYELNRALLSRCRVVVFERLNEDNLRHIVARAEKQYKKPMSEVLQPEAIENLLQFSDGDARRLINSLEILYSFMKDGQEAPLSTNDMRELLQQNPIGYDKNSEMHYDLISAFIKSVRGSDPDAAVYYLARMLDGGEDPIFIARRLIILASEDISNADPRAISVAIAGLQAVEAIGLPEGAITLSQVTTYLASCPKSNASYMALHKARALVEQTKTLPVPLHLRSAKTALAKEMGYGRDYKYPHDYPSGWTEQSYLPEELQAEKIYEPTSHGFEKNIREYLAWMKQRRSENKE
ncbi:replication-associated recombination protein A [Bdellovibrio sp. SKB1291214]|uniref:replication-associated recombination protein A n=1 Tax=Bdellovibrio sp. SKB1291214 TaxID=1732569 RepID=UPI00223E9605|nr:replication-associated recombination protein A [Bdellovibrio sp. SKB1291214]UYL08959.1 replication-associated recombination protein A [Bdellovibrio sp. SKB1291214]